MIRTFLRVMLWFAINFVMPAWLVIVGLNIFSVGAGLHFHIDHNSLTYLGLFLVRLALPVTPPSPSIKMMPLGRLPADDAFMQELEKALKEEARKDQVKRDIADQTGWTDETEEKQDKKDDNSGSGSSGH